MRIAIVGAGGFVGKALVERLARDGHELAPVVRTPRGLPGECRIDDLLGADWDGLLAGSDAVVHLAARVHMMKDTADDPLAEFRRVNVAGAMAVAEAAARQGVRRFVFVSTVKVNGEETAPGRPFRADDPPGPSDPYGISKHEAEQALFALSGRTGLEVTVIRPPLVYGPDVRGNLASLFKWLRRGVPMPLGAVNRNRRSLVGVENLADLIALAALHPAAAGQVFLAADGRDVSTTELLRLIGAALGVRPRLLPFPPGLILAAASAAGKGAAARRLLGNLQVDIAKTRDRLGWSPPVPIEEGLRRAAAGAGA